MKVKEIKNKDIWENKLKKIREKTFLDSWNWGEFNKLMGNKIWRLAVYDQNDIKSLALVIKIEARRGKFIFLPHGPAIEENLNYEDKKEILQTLLDRLKIIAKSEKVSFIRIAPLFIRTKENKKIFSSLGFIQAPLHIHPEVTWILDIKPDKETLLKNMRKTTRYLIRKAQKDGVKIEQSQKLEDIKIFNKLYQETVKRHHFVPFSLLYLENELRAFSPDNQILTFLAKYKNEVLASAIIIFWQGKAFYHQGASSSKYPKIPAAYLLQEKAIEEAKKRGCTEYNFWGITPEIKSLEDLKNKKIKRHPWWGLSLFKIGFGGKRKEYVKTQDFALSWEYWLTAIFEKIRKIKRHL